MPDDKPVPSLKEMAARQVSPQQLAQNANAAWMPDEGLIMHINNVLNVNMPVPAAGIQNDLHDRIVVLQKAYGANKIVDFPEEQLKQLQVDFRSYVDKKDLPTLIRLYQNLLLAERKIATGLAISIGTGKRPLFGVTYHARWIKKRKQDE